MQCHINISSSRSRKAGRQAGRQQAATLRSISAGTAGQPGTYLGGCFELQNLLLVDLQPLSSHCLLLLAHLRSAVGNGPAAEEIWWAAGIRGSYPC